jgi:hypothetical protein
VGLDELKDWVQLGQGAVTTVAIVIAGVWAYYSFVVGRSATAHVQIECGLKQVITTANGQILAVSVTLRNTGRTRVDGLSCDITVAPVTYHQSNRGSLALIDPLPIRVVDEGERGSDFAWSLMFKRLVALEPNEEVAEDILLLVGNTLSASVDDGGTLAAEVACGGRVFGGRVLLRRRPGAWVWRGVLESRTAGE